VSLISSYLHPVVKLDGEAYSWCGNVQFAYLTSALIGCGNAPRCVHPQWFTDLIMLVTLEVYGVAPGNDFARKEKNICCIS
jgi:hypothetical protein